MKYSRRDILATGYSRKTLQQCYCCVTPLSYDTALSYSTPWYLLSSRFGHAFYGTVYLVPLYSGLLRLANAVIVIYSLDMVRSASSVLYL